MKINADRKVIENLPPHIFSNLGIDQIAYVTENENQEYLVHAADGNIIYACNSLEEAEDHIKLKDMISITLH